MKYTILSSICPEISNSNKNNNDKQYIMREKK